MPHRETDTKNINVRELASAAFTVPVNYDDPRWNGIQHASYAYVNPDLRLKHFPIGSRGVSEVVMEYVTFDHGPTTQEVLDKIERLGLRRPDRAEAESFLDTHPEEQKMSSFIGLGVSVVGRPRGRDVACVFADGGRRCLGFDWLGNHWSQYDLFLAVRK